MNRSQRLVIVEKLIQQQEEQLARALTMARENVQREQHRLDELTGYQNSYEDEFHSQAQKGISGQQWQSYQHFISQLEQVIKAQQHTILMAQRQANEVMQRWKKIHLKRKSMSSFIESVRFEEWVAQEKLEQKQNDELVTQMFSRTRQ
ncbi:flagellar export protein FliJ [Gynuella sp.]|uniref:flagellar export protein FliJ n=1 Tax=Gynuella sp. TaxID=2969146 RepID=UPI003D1181BC